jgi:exodeoxyribonuclease VII large subunit
MRDDFELWANVNPTQPRHVWGVGALLHAVADALQARFNPVRVHGEVSGFIRAASGHCYFSIKDETGQIRCALFKRAAQMCAVAWRDGLKVELDGRLDVYGARGELQLIVEQARVAGQGSLYEQFLRLKAELEAEGLFSPERKRPLVAYPRSIGVVTSLDAAALRDVATTLQRRVPHVPVRVFASPVQGDAAVPGLCAALEAAYSHHNRTGECDVLLLVRGGGSLEDLWSFNHPDVVRCVARAPMPVVCGVGHETDFTLADFVADVRAPTPTAAAELCAPDRARLLQHLLAQQHGLALRVRRLCDTQQQRLDQLGQRLGQPSARLARDQHRLQQTAFALQQRVQAVVAQHRTHLQRAQTDLPAALQRDVQRRHQQWHHAQARLQLLNPKLVLQRGYALLTDEQGHVLTRAQQVQAGQTVQAELSEGRLEMTIKMTVKPAGS